MSKLKLQNSFTNNIALLILRVSFGATMLIGHGLGKWEKLFSGEEIKFLDPIGLGAPTALALAVFAEVVCSVLIMFGLLTRLALIPLIVTMAIALNVHAHDAFSVKEKAILYLVVFVVLLIKGPGKISLDGILRK